MNPTQEDCHAAIASDHVTWTYRGSVSCRCPCHRPAYCRRTVHLTRMLILPARERLPERAIQGSARRLAARLPRHLLGPSRMEGSVFAASRYGSPGSIWPPLWRWILYAGDRRGWRHRIGRLASPRCRISHRKGETRESDRRVG